MHKNSLGDSVKPIYEFSWDDSTRRTDDLENGSVLGTAGVELLAELGRDDVEHVGYES